MEMDTMEKMDTLEMDTLEKMDTMEKMGMLDMGTLALTYRMAAIGDIDLLALTRTEFIIEMHGDMTDSQRAELYESNKAYFAETLCSGEFLAYLAFDGDALVATSGINFYKTPPAFKNLTGKTAYISNMYTKPDYRGRGIATRLFEMTVMEAKKRGCGRVELIATNMGRPIYEKYGFEVMDGAMKYYFK